MQKRLPSPSCLGSRRHTREGDDDVREMMTGRMVRVLFPSLILHSSFFPAACVLLTSCV